MIGIIEEYKIKLNNALLKDQSLLKSDYNIENDLNE